MFPETPEIPEVPGLPDCPDSPETGRLLGVVGRWVMLSWDRRGRLLYGIGC